MQERRPPLLSGPAIAIVVVCSSNALKLYKTTLPGSYYTRIITIVKRQSGSCRSEWLSWILLVTSAEACARILQSLIPLHASAAIKGIVAVVGHFQCLSCMPVFPD